MYWNSCWRRHHCQTLFFSSSCWIEVVRVCCDSDSKLYGPKCRFSSSDSHAIQMNATLLISYVIHVIYRTGESQQLWRRHVRAIHPCQTHRIVKHWWLVDQGSVQVRHALHTHCYPLMFFLWNSNSLLFAWHENVISFIIKSARFTVTFLTLLLRHAVCRGKESLNILNTNIIHYELHFAGHRNALHHREYLDPVTGQTQQYCTLTGENPVCILDPYPTSNILQIKRATARRVGSTYAPDFLGLMEVALINSWQVYLISRVSFISSCIDDVLLHVFQSMAVLLHWMAYSLCYICHCPFTNSNFIQFPWLVFGLISHIHRATSREKDDQVLLLLPCSLSMNWSSEKTAN